MAAPERLQVSVVYAAAGVRHRILLEVPRGTTVRGALERSRLTEICPGIDLAVNRVGIYGELRSLDELLEDGDRVEIYRPLVADPKEIRRRRARSAATGRPGR